jgi:pimeloyl-ACP methyl ester carboxylesterase
MTIPALPGITVQTVETPRIRMCVRSSGPADGAPVIFVHGNVSSGVFWEETMLALPATYRAIAPDLRGYGDTEALPIDATRGLRDWSDDLRALVEALGLGRVHLVGWSLGGGIVMQYAIDHPADVASITLSAPMSPYGFGATRDAVGTPTNPDFAGSGGGAANPEFVQRLAQGDRGTESPNSPRNVMNAFYFRPPFRAAPEREEVFATSMLATRTGEGFYPGDMTVAEHWPGIAPGKSGVNNAFSPKYCNLSGFADIDPKPPVLWICGDSDQIISDTSLFDFATLGQLGLVPGWPGAEVCPPQPMIAQIRTVLDAYAARSGHYVEHELSECGHSPHIEKPEAFRDLLAAHLGG